MRKLHRGGASVGNFEDDVGEAGAETWVKGSWINAQTCAFVDEDGLGGCDDGMINTNSMVTAAAIVPGVGGASQSHGVPAWWNFLGADILVRACFFGCGMLFTFLFFLCPLL